MTFHPHKQVTGEVAKIIFPLLLDLSIQFKAAEQPLNARRLFACLCLMHARPRALRLYSCLHEADLGEALLVDMVHHHNFIVIAGWRAPRAEKRQTQRAAG